MTNMVDHKSMENEVNMNNDDEPDDSEEENDTLEESPCGRWLKRREEVEQRDIPGIDATYLAMDTEEGVEVVWNEVQFSERKYFKAKEETISEVFDRLIQLDHPNIVKLHKYWIHKDAEKPRVIFITEYMSSGSLKQFLRKTKRNVIKMALPAWKRWCTQILSALHYLHSSQPPIVHGNLTCDTIFISHNGLIKIGAVAPDAIHKHVKTVRGDAKSNHMNIHFIAPEVGTMSENENGSSDLSPAVDIYSFGICALEMAALEIAGNGDTGTHITDDTIQKTIESLDNPLQKDFIRLCLSKDCQKRPSTREMLLHPIIFEVPSLRLFSAQRVVKIPHLQPEQLTELQELQDDMVLAEIKHTDRPGVCIKHKDAPKREMSKFIEEVRNGAYPLAVIVPNRPSTVSRQRTLSPEVSGESSKQLNSPENPYEEETRRISNMMCNVKPHDRGDKDKSDKKRVTMTLILHMDDEITRHLSCEVEPSDSPPTIADELVYYGFINKVDRDMVGAFITDTLNRKASLTSDQPVERLEDQPQNQISTSS